MITDDIRDTFKDQYVGKIINDYNHKMLFIGAILVYFRGLKGNVLDASPTAVNTVDIDEDEAYHERADSRRGCPYYHFYDEYKLVQKQN